MRNGREAAQKLSRRGGAQDHGRLTKNSGVICPGDSELEGPEGYMYFTHAHALHCPIRTAPCYQVISLSILWSLTVAVFGFSSPSLSKCVPSSDADQSPSPPRLRIVTPPIPSLCLVRMPAVYFACICRRNYVEISYISSNILPQVHQNITQHACCCTNTLPGIGDRSKRKWHRGRR